MTMIRRKPCPPNATASRSYQLRSRGPVGPEVFKVLDRLKPSKITKTQGYSYNAGIRLRLVPKPASLRPEDSTGSALGSLHHCDRGTKLKDGDGDKEQGTSFSVEQLVYQSLPYKDSPPFVKVQIEVVEKVPLDAFIDAKYIPSDDDAEFQRRAELWQDPAAEDPEANPTDVRHSRKVELTDFFEAVRCDRYRDHTDARMFLFMWLLLDGFPSRQNGTITFLGDGYFPLWPEHAVKHDGVYFEYYVAIWRFIYDRELISAPLALCTCNNERGRAGIARYEIPPLLLQANQNARVASHLAQNRAYVLSLQGWKLTFVKATMSRQDALGLGNPQCLPGKVKVERTTEYNLRDRGQRREALRALMGLFLSFQDRPEFAYALAPDDSYEAL
ncbi:uncharacterized protein BO97DRAFT_452352 [Aspergillus homomorphus CBS 101889]|uniref:Uncharacterized protein n=1 Tax=Aspergillus homomorphus (strain CBS 101889) TaxID=1450537 RepID=A0A395HVS3_ASPHC|nr:hypothetical protein BO97DRAFT_452352 [Aspergillus homomorphus CBS 101889]RAL12022.1 hypothetical protein BO97DRAFT_452352 [Aspergillus homomorphus CBS 101889]